MDNHSMTLESRFYLKTYCTASKPLPYRKPRAGKQKQRASLVTCAVDSVVRGAGWSRFPIEARLLFPDL